MSNIFKRTNMCGDFTRENIGEEAVINGWIAKRRNLASAIADIVILRSGK